MQTGLGGDDESRRHVQADLRHFAQIRALAAQQFLVLAVAFGKCIDPLVAAILNTRHVASPSFGSDHQTHTFSTHRAPADNVSGRSADQSALRMTEVNWVSAKQPGPVVRTGHQSFMHVNRRTRASAPIRCNSQSRPRRYRPHSGRRRDRHRPPARRNATRIGRRIPARKHPWMFNRRLGQATRAASAQSARHLQVCAPTQRARTAGLRRTPGRVSLPSACVETAARRGSMASR